MLTLSYAISPRLKENLNKIENFRKEILLSSISPSLKLKLRWEAIFNRTFRSLRIAGNSLSAQEMLKVLSHIGYEKMSAFEEDVVKYKKAQDFIFQNWLGSENPIDAQSIISLHKIIGNGSLRSQKSQLQYFMDYLQARQENPVIIAGIANIEMEKMQFFVDKNKQIANLTSLLFLYRLGYDFRGFLAYESEWVNKENDLIASNYKEHRARAMETSSLTLWLEYFAECILKNLEKIAQSLEKPKAKILDLRDSFFRLNERQKSILSFLDQPQATITNRQIQKRYKTSQITASRDLAKLTNLGLLFSYGKGRAVYYAKI